MEQQCQKDLIELKEFQNFKKPAELDSVPVAVMPWKLFESDILFQDEEPEFYKKYQDKIAKYSQVLQKLNLVMEEHELSPESINESDKKEEILKAFYQEFPDNDKYEDKLIKGTLGRSY